MSASVDLSAAQVEALTALHNLVGHDRWALIGASAIRCRLPLPRPTADVDFAIAVSGDTVHARLAGAGWKRDPKKHQRWTYGAAMIDVVPATEDDLLAGVTYLEDGVTFSVVGLDLAFSKADQIRVREGLAVPVPPLPVLVLLKMIAWLERRYERGKDLDDIVFIWDNALPEQDDCRWDPKHPVAAAALDYEDQSAFFAGWQLGKIAAPEHLHWAKRFLDIMRTDESIEFAQLVRESRYGGDGVEGRLRARLTAFERGLEAGATGGMPVVEISRAPIPSRVTPRIETVRSRESAGLLSWGRSGSLEMLLHDAIDKRRIVRFVYDRHVRIAEPHVLGTKNGRLQILMWQTGGQSSSGSLPDWRRFFVDQLSGVEILSDTFAGPRLPRSRHSAFDRQIAVVQG
jgi:predicted nucleotidyltransferase